MTDIQESIYGVSRNIDRALHGQHDREQQAILDWLTSHDYSSQQNDFIARRQEKERVNGLLSQRNSSNECTLFCPGNPGSGKTMMVSIVILWLTKMFRNDPGIGIAFSYYLVVIN